MLEGVWVKGKEPSCPWVGMQSGVATVESNVEVLQKIKSGAAI